MSEKYDVSIPCVESRIMLKFPKDADLFITFKKLFKKKGFSIRAIDRDCELIKIPPELPAGFVDRVYNAYFFVTIMKDEEKEFYEFLQEFCNRRKISFRNPLEDPEYIREQEILQEAFNKSFPGV
ncbi:hypothetical protein K9M48_00730 [Candidatus Gracilibacteria bacterium]|nr:hypothetical protein [Candidatus Gracilibacteria bacterium]